jgi:hypothetical protein
MAPRNKVDQLAPEIREEAFELLRQGRTVDEITAHLRQLGADVSRSGVHRWTVKEQEGMDALKRATALGKAWATDLKRDPEGKLGRLLIELAQTNILDNMLAPKEEGDDGQAQPMDPLQLYRLSTAIAKLEAAGTVSLDREQRIRRDIAAQAADKAVEVATADGASAEAIAKLRAAVLTVGG